MSFREVLAGCRRPARSFVLVALALAACAPGPRSDLSFEQVRRSSLGKTKAEVLRQLGRPDSCEGFLGDSEVCVWRGFVAPPEAPQPATAAPAVDLEITFVAPAGSDPRTAPRLEWRALGPLAVSYSSPPAR